MQTNFITAAVVFIFSKDTSEKPYRKWIKPVCSEYFILVFGTRLLLLNSAIEMHIL